MNSIIYWFSGTGNSLFVAQELAKALGETRLVPLAGFVSRPIQPHERVGLVFPVYAFGLPLIVRRFLKYASFKGAKYIYTIATMAGMAGGVHHECKELLAKQNASLSSGWTIIMPSNYPVLSQPPPAGKQEKLFVKAREKVKEIAGHISGGKTGIYEDSWLFLGRLLGLMRQVVIHRFPDTDANFVVDDNCTGCGVCARVCPVENIRLVNGRPLWLHHCEQCVACLQWCPPQAINYGKRTVGKKRYHHPQCKAGDLMLREE